MADLTLRELGTDPKGSALTNAEIDGNFLELQDRIAQLQQSLPAQIADGAFMAAIIYGG
jgi:hypothetical protein